MNFDMSGANNEDVACVDLVSDDGFSGSTVSDAGANASRSADIPVIERLLNQGKEIWHVRIPAMSTTKAIDLNTSTLLEMKVALEKRLSLVAYTFEERDESEEKGPFVCEACLQDFSDPSCYIEHVKICPIICNVCGNLFPDEKHAVHHMRLHGFGISGPDYSDSDGNILSTPTSSEPRGSKKMPPSHKCMRKLNGDRCKTRGCNCVMCD